ncbi:phage holin family protein [Altericroceibacterium spongiae]|uniref:Phage holin family protein n=1 Tax=Altericroceibacterium spongiae TaxID=2320269 RepID=A0A420ECE6_9SPHN|nr:phage holin family protein [Altericroceibacterium spongiae]RKF18358.1 phage holin family protein [Altericroceibacterium spongiae]
MTAPTDEKYGPAGAANPSRQAGAPHESGAQSAFSSESHAGSGAAGSEAGADSHPLRDDLTALIDDGLTFFEAELNFQKSRLSFVIDCAKKVAAYGVVALVLVLLAAIGLTVGLILCLSPLITPWGATIVVVGGELAIAYYCVRHILTKVKAISAAFKKEEDASE